jgi:hypothetical protein
MARLTGMRRTSGAGFCADCVPPRVRSVFVKIVNMCNKFSYLSDSEKIQVLVIISYVLSVGVIASSVAVVMCSWQIVELRQTVNFLVDAMNAK